MQLCLSFLVTFSLWWVLCFGNAHPGIDVNGDVRPRSGPGSWVWKMNRERAVRDGLLSQLLRPGVQQIKRSIQQGGSASSDGETSGGNEEDFRKSSQSASYDSDFSEQLSEIEEAVFETTPLATTAATATEPAVAMEPEGRPEVVSDENDDGPVTYVLPFTEQRPLRVLVHELRPFAFQLPDGTWDGFMVELWDFVARDYGWSYTISPAQSIGSLLADVKAGQFDLGFGGLSLTSSRQRSIEFSLPTFQSGLLILIKKPKEAGLLDVVFSHQIWTATCLALLALFGAGHVIYFLERDVNPPFHGHSYLNGLWRSVWWAGVTVTTVGYGDQVPRTRSGKLFAMIWMVFGLLMVGYLSGSISSQLTVSKLQKGIRNANDLPGKTVATKLNTTSAHYLERNGIKSRLVRDMTSAYDLLDDGAVDAVVFDGPSLLYYTVREGRDRGFRVVGSPFEEQSYGFAVKRGRAALLDDIDVAVLKIREDYRYSSLADAWFGVNQDIYLDEQFVDDDPDRTFNWVLYGVTISLLLLLFLVNVTNWWRSVERVYNSVASAAGSPGSGKQRYTGGRRATKTAAATETGVGDHDHEFVRLNESDDEQQDHDATGGSASSTGGRLGFRPTERLLANKLASLELTMEALLDKLDQMPSKQGN